MTLVGRLGRGIFTGAVILAAIAVVLLSLADPGALLVWTPLALALAFLLSGRRQESLPLVLAGNVLAVVAVAVLALVHFQR